MIREEIRAILIRFSASSFLCKSNIHSCSRALRDRTDLFAFRSPRIALKISFYFSNESLHHGRMFLIIISRDSLRYTCVYRFKKFILYAKLNTSKIYLKIHSNLMNRTSLQLKRNITALVIIFNIYYPLNLNSKRTFAAILLKHNV